MHRYLSSSIISTFFYLLVAGSIFYFFTVKSYSDKDMKVKEIHKICFSIITPEIQPEIEPEKEKITKIKPKPELKSKPKPKPKPKPEPKPKPKPKLEPKPIPELVEKNLISETLEDEPASEPVKAEQTKNKKLPSKTNATINKDMTEAKKQIFLADLIKRINSNKSYPHTARRRSVEGTVEIEFMILADGNVKDIKIISGKKIFKKSATDAIRNSFPVKIDSTLFSFPKKFKINITYILK